MTKKKIYLVILILFIGLGTYLVANTIELARYKKTLATGSELPEATFIDLHNASFSTTSIGNHKSVIMFFSISCPHCQSEFESLNKSPERFNHLSVYLVGKEPIGEIGEFIAQYPIVQSNAAILSDPENQFLKTFGSSVVPNTFIYENRKLLKNIKGEFDLGSL